MQREINAMNPRRPVRIFGVSDVASEGRATLLVMGRTLPVVQDTAAMNVARAWATTLRDVVILDANNHRVGVYNLSEHNLMVPESYAALRSMLVGFGNAP